MPISYELSVEEVALAMSIQGCPQAANGLLQATFGTLGAEEQRGRLMAAGASLAARSLLSVEDEKNPALDPGLSRVIAILLTPRFTVKYDKAQPGSLESVAYHFAREDGLVVEQTLRRGVVHRLEEVEPLTVVKRGVKFFAIPNQVPADAGRVRIPRAVFDDARARASLQPTTAQALLEKAGLPAQWAQMLVEDLRKNKYQGSVMRIDYDAEGRPVSDRGFLMLQSSGRTWILSIFVEQQNAFVSPVLASADVFQHEVEGLCQ